MTAPDDPLVQLCRNLGHDFSDRGLLEQALTHSSAGKGHYERLEFLGDSVLSLVITEFLYARFPDKREGKLSRIRASLVNRESLTGLAQDLDLGRYLNLGRGELRSGAHRRHSILADAMEAVIGAIYLDAGFAVCRERVLEFYSVRLADPELGTPVKDHKTRLQEFLMARGDVVPEYRLVSESGPPHKRRFAVECAIAGENEPVPGEGRSRRQAEQDAARRMLIVLGELEPEGEGS